MVTNSKNGNPTHLHQLLAASNKVAADCKRDLTAEHKRLLHADGLTGMSRTYLPIDDTGDRMPPDDKILQVRTPDVLRRVAEILSKGYDIIAQRDFTNCNARADLEFEGKVLVKNAPAVFLLWLEKQLDDVHTLVSKLPTLPPDAVWEWDNGQNAYKTEPVETRRALQEYYGVTLAPPTDKHPAQVKEHAREKTVGHWTQIRYHGGLKVKEVRQMKDRVERLQAAVKFAREKANRAEIEQIKVGDTLMKVIFGEHLEV